MKEYIFIDAPGLARNDMEDGMDLARLIASHPEIDTHLVLPASMKPADMARVIEQYEIFQPKKLLFTRTDETVSSMPAAPGAYRFPGGTFKRADPFHPPCHFVQARRVDENVLFQSAPRWQDSAIAFPPRRSRCRASQRSRN